MKILVTGAAGFIGMHVARALLRAGETVVGIDNLNPYYDPALKLARLEQLNSFPTFRFYKSDISNGSSLSEIFKQEKPLRVVHLAAQAGVRYSLENPAAYVNSNLVGFANMLEVCRHNDVEHLVYASSSSVYGSNSQMPFSVHANVDHPVSLYAASKKSNELMAHSYSHLFGLPTTGLRYFTVYGPWGRPDMSPWLFTSAINDGREIDVFNYGKMKRDFTYIDDIVEGTIGALSKISTPSTHFRTKHPDPSISSAPYKIYNIGNNKPVEILRFIDLIESALGKRTKKNMLPLQPGDLIETFADIEDSREEIGFQPMVGLSDGISRWTRWYLKYQSH